MSGNLGLKQNGSVRFNWKSFEKKSVHLLRRITHFSRLDQSDRNRPFHLTPFSIPVARCSVVSMSKMPGGKHLSLQLLWIVNRRSIGVTCTSMCSYNRFVAASKAKCIFWLSTALKDDLFPEPIWSVLFVIRKWCLNSYGKYLGMVCSK